MTAEDARSWLRAEITPDLGPLESAIADARADGYASGSLALAASGLDPSAAAQVFGPDLASAWSDWKPGDADAAALLDDEGFQRMMRDSNFLTDIGDTTLDRMGTALADGAAQGLSVDEIAGHLSDLLDDPDRAYTIADTELARATSAASLDTYAFNGVEKWEWLLSPEACLDCVEKQETNPHDLNDEAPPLHPHCRCSVSPVEPGLPGEEEEALAAEEVATSEEPTLDYAIKDWLGGKDFAEGTVDSPAGGGITDKVDQASVDRITREIAENGTPSKTALFRGLAVPEDTDIEEMVRNLGASSFSPSMNGAVAYAEGASYGLDAMGVEADMVILRLDPGVLALNIDEQGLEAWGEEESIVAGRFHIVDMTLDDEGFQIYHLRPGS